MPHIPRADHQLHDVVEQLVREHGRASLDWITRQARKISRDPRIDEDEVDAALSWSTMVMW